MRKGDTFCQLHAHHLLLCEGNHCQAHFLSLLERKSHLYIKNNENGERVYKIRANHYKDFIEFDEQGCPIIPLSMPEIERLLLYNYGEKTLTAELANLERKGFISTTQKEFGKDRIKYYALNIPFLEYYERTYYDVLQPYCDELIEAFVRIEKTKASIPTRSIEALKRISLALLSDEETKEKIIRNALNLLPSSCFQPEETEEPSPIIDDSHTVLLRYAHTALLRHAHTALLRHAHTALLRHHNNIVIFITEIFISNYKKRAREKENSNLSEKNENENLEKTPSFSFHQKLNNCTPPLAPPPPTTPPAVSHSTTPAVKTERSEVAPVKVVYDQNGEAYDFYKPLPCEDSDCLYDKFLGLIMYNEEQASRIKRAMELKRLNVATDDIPIMIYDFIQHKCAGIESAPKMSFSWLMSEFLKSIDWLYQKRKNFANEQEKIEIKGVANKQMEARNNMYAQKIGATEKSNALNDSNTIPKKGDIPTREYIVILRKWAERDVANANVQFQKMVESYRNCPSITTEQNGIYVQLCQILGIEVSEKFNVVS